MRTIRESLEAMVARAGIDHVREFHQGLCELPEDRRTENTETVRQITEQFLSEEHEEARMPREQIAADLKAAALHYYDSVTAGTATDWHRIHTLLRLSHQRLSALDGVRRRDLRAVRRACVIAKGEVDGTSAGPLSTVPAMIKMEHLAESLRAPHPAAAGR
ncbi:hypothetical protein [Streptomyces sp. bgisy153]|uniref:hypothetical protein n=1 Tax=Streptomyces sp. bgisy153 TaxID=3413793 RepID=UPI003D75389F